MARNRAKTRQRIQALLETQERACSNRDCPDYGQTSGIVKNGHDRRGRQRYRCKTCQRGFTATYGTPFRKLKTDWVEVLEALALLAERNSLSAVARVKQIKRDTLANWLKKVGAYAQEVEEILVREFGVSQVQLDELWTYVANRGGKGGILRAKRPESSGKRPPLTPRASCE